MTTERILLVLLVSGIGIGCFFVLQPFLPALLWAAILVLTTEPVVEWLNKVAKLPRSLAALLMVALTALILVLPLVLAAPGSANEITLLSHDFETWITQIPPAPAFLIKIPLVGQALSDTWNAWAADLSEMARFFRPYLGMAAERGLSLLVAIAGGLVQLVMALFAAFCFWLWSKPMGEIANALILRIAGDELGPVLAQAIVRTVRGTVYGLLGTAIIQGFLVAFGLALVDVPRVMLLGTFTAFLAVLPIGAPLVWIPAGLWLLSTGHTARGVFLLVYGVVVVSGLDHVLRPWLISKGSGMPFLLILLGVLGGVLAFGAVGLFIGPVFLSLGYSLASAFIRPKLAAAEAFGPENASRSARN